MEQQQKSELFPKVIDMPEIKLNLLPTTSKSTSSILNKLLPHDSPQKDEISSAFKRVLPSLPSIDSVMFMQQDNTDDYTSADMQRAEMIEIEVPVIGSEYIRRTRDKVNRMDYEYDSNGDLIEDSNGYYEINAFPATSSSSEPESAETTEYQTSSEPEAITKSFYQTPSSSFSTTDTASYYSTLTSTESTQDMHAIESKLMDQYIHDQNSVENDDDENLIDEHKQDILVDQQQSQHSQKQYQHEFPFNVKVIVNNEDPKTSCKNKKSCSQVNFSTKTTHDIDQEYYKDDSDEDLFFESKTDFYSDKTNQVKSRRAADDGFFNAFNTLSLTPAPRFSGLNPKINNNFRVPTPKKPSFLERLENESSLEKSERLNKDLNNLMKFIAVWSHVDKFVSDRARTTIKKLAYMTDEDYVDNYLVGSRKRNDKNLNMIAKNADEPFT